MHQEDAALSETLFKISAFHLIPLFIAHNCAKQLVQMAVRLTPSEQAV